MENTKKKITSCLSALAIAGTLVASHVALDNSTLIGRYNLQDSRIDRNYYFDYSYDTAYGDSNLLNLIIDKDNEVLYDDMVPQGITIVDDYFLVSTYDPNYLNKSHLSLYDKNFNFIKSIELCNRAHVGSISYDRKRELLWVSGCYGCVDAYTMSSIMNSDGAVKPIYKDVYVGKNLPSYINPFINSVSYLTIDGDYLYVGNYSLFDDATLKKYEISIDDEKTLHLNHKSSYKLPSKVQGISIYHDKYDDYLFLSRSCGRKYSSILQVYEFSDEIKDYRAAHSVAIEAPRMLEQVTIDNDRLYILNESQAKKYFTRHNDTIVETDVKKLIKKI